MDEKLFLTVAFLDPLKVSIHRIGDEPKGVCSFACNDLKNVIAEMGGGFFCNFRPETLRKASMLEKNILGSKKNDSDCILKMI